ncbi:MAG: VOC family protein [Chloroflexi bacterium]|nr:VOC family protein [Chloroflexota bacterium]
MKQITPCLWFDSNAEEAVSLYMSVFPNAKILSMSRYGEGGPGPAGQVMVAMFEINGQEYMALNGGPQYKPTPAVSFLVNCETQAEVDHLWEKLSEGGHKDQCGWLQDRFGFSWQIVPTALGELMGDPDPLKAGRVMQAMLKMGKLDIAELQRAYDGG